MKLKLNNKEYTLINCVCESDNGLLQVCITDQEYSFSEITKELSNIKTLKVIDDDNEEMELQNTYKNFVEAYECEGGVWVAVSSADYVEESTTETIEQQITDLQLAIVELYEMLEV